MSHIDITPPSNEPVESIIRSLRPCPSPRFYERMQKSPWFEPSSRRHFQVDSFYPRFLAPAFIVVILLLICSLAFPTLRVVAEQVLHYFILEPNDRLEIITTINPPKKDNSFSLTLSEVATLVSFPLKEISHFPIPLVFTGARYESLTQAVTLQYSDQVNYLYFTQREIGHIEEYASIGGSAPAEKIPVRGVIGEYVTGGWTTKVNNDLPPKLIEPGLQITVSVYWDSTFPQSILRWQENGMSYQLLSRGEKEFGKNDLIKIAESIR